MTIVEQMRPGDVVSFAYPYREGIAPYARPSLVLEVSENEVLLAYGTTSSERANVGYELRISEEYSDCGLARPSRFVFARRIRVRATDPRFARNAAGTARLGHLTRDLMTRQTALMRQIRGSWDSETARQAAERDGIHPGRGRRGRRRAKSAQSL